MTATSTRSAPDPTARYGVTLEDPPDMTVELERYGQGYRVLVTPMHAEFVFRDVRVDRSPTSDIAVALRGRHLFRTGDMTMSLTSRNALARTLQDFAPLSDASAWKRATFATFEKVMLAEEQIETTDLRTVGREARRRVFVAGHFLVDGPSLIVMPGESGKSTLGRALAVGFADHREVVPGIPPGSQGPVLYVAAEAALIASHRRSIEAICRGIGTTPEALQYPIELYATHGKPLHRIVRQLAERARDAALVVLDSYQALAIVSEHSAGIRERDTIFWNAVDQIERPTLIIAHPNRDDAQRWDKSDGRAAGSDVSRDRARISWKGKFRDEEAIAGQSYRRYTLICTKFNDGPRPAPIGLGVQWIHGTDDEDPGKVEFIYREPELRAPTPPKPAAATDDQGGLNEQELSPMMRATLEAYRAGATTPSALQQRFPGLSRMAADKRLVRVRQLLGESGQTTMEGG